MIFAEIDPSVIGLLVQSLTALLLLALTGLQLFKGASGKDGERQIEPTAIHAITSELQSQTRTLNKLDRESGERAEVIRSVKETVDDLRKVQREDTDKLHQRLGGISRDLAGTIARVDGIEKRER